MDAKISKKKICSKFFREKFGTYIKMYRIRLSEFC